MPPKTMDLRERLHTLANALSAIGLRAVLEKDRLSAEPFVRVINPERPTYRDKITVLACEDHGHELWFFHSWLAPISPADDISGAVIAIRDTLTPRPGARDVEP